MAHSLFTGVTEIGKTTLARNMCKGYMRVGFHTIVLDPLLDPGWGASFMTQDSDEFISRCKVSKKCMLFMDEGSESVGRYNTEMQWTATQARHWGHSSHFICQEATQVAAVVRNMCTHAFCFNTGFRSAQLLAEEFNAPDLVIATSLQRGEYFHAVKGGACTFHSSKRRYADAFNFHVDRERSFRDRRRNGITKKAGQDDSNGDGGSGGDGGIADGTDGDGKSDG